MYFCEVHLTSTTKQVVEEALNLLAKKVCAVCPAVEVLPDGSEGSWFFYSNRIFELTPEFRVTAELSITGGTEIRIHASVISRKPGETYWESVCDVSQGGDDLHKRAREAALLLSEQTDLVVKALQLHSAC